MANPTDDHQWLGHAYTIDRQRGGMRSLAVPGLCMRTISVPSLGICEEVWGTLVVASESARRMIDAHIADAPQATTAEERAERNAEVYGRF